MVSIIKLFGRFFGPAVVFVLIPTFNQRNYISQAIEGALAQRSKFPVIIIIRDDASTDGTAEIVRDYQIKHPTKIRAILRTSNGFALESPMVEMLTLAHEILGSMPRKYSLDRAFIAFCEGDDYWNHPGKLRKQLAVLGRHQKATIAHHDAQILLEDESMIGYRDSLQAHLEAFRPKERVADGSLLDAHNFVLTCTAVLRLSVVDIDEIKRRPRGLVVGDWINFALAGRQGRVVYNPKKMATYRLHSGSSFSSATESERFKRGAATVEYLEQIPDRYA